MIEIQGNFWDCAPKYKMIGVTTNGIVKDNGELVMGKGIAKEFKKRFPFLPQELGERVEKSGNRPYFIPIKNQIIFSFPTKNDYREDSDIDLIMKNATYLSNWIEINTSMNFLNAEDCALLTRPGCGNGNLDWELDVRPIIENIFSNRIHIIFNGE
jgi:hypothetical protein